MMLRTSARSRLTSRHTYALLGVFAVLLGGGGVGCSCAVGRPGDVGDAATDVPRDLGTPDTGTPDTGAVDMGMVDMGTVDMGMGDGGMTLNCGNGMLDTEEGELCDPALPGTTIDALLCICTPDSTLCTDDVWVPDPALGQCYGSCQHPPRTGFGINTCDDSIACTVDVVVSGDPSMCNVTCSNLPISNTDTTCDGVDDDCNGMIDDGFVPAATTCGVGACASTGMTSCTDGVFADSCTEGTPANSDATCDGIDDDCSGDADEDFAVTGTTCGVGACASTGLTSCVNGVYANSCTAGTAAANDPTCDNVDDDCDGTRDEDYAPVAIFCGIGGCRRMGMTACAAGGVITQACTEGAPEPEICDTIDNDCDGMLNDGNPDGGDPCMTGMLGVCNPGTTVCTMTGALVCQQNVQASAETCDGLDNNCNGTPDDGNPQGGGSCPTGNLGVCSAGTLMCSGGSLSCVQNVASSTEVCDAVDNDCDGSVNEGNPQGGGSCSTGLPGICNAGTYVCGSTDTMLRCQQNQMPQQEICDGYDNDCNGGTDINAYVNDGMPNSCAASAGRTVSVAPGAANAVVVNGTVDPNGDDYFVVNFTGAGNAGVTYRPRIQLTSGTGTYVFSLETTCGNATAQCGTGTYTDFTMNYSTTAPGTYPSLCIAPGTCTDNVPKRSSWIVRVRRVAGGNTNCTGYTLTLSNI